MAYTRLTMIGSSRKADLVLPDDEPVGALLPQLLEVLDERIPGGCKVALTTLAGVHIELDSTLGDRGVGHGTMIHLTPLDDALHPPEIVDITDTVATAARRRGDHWGEVVDAASVTTLSAVVAGIVSVNVQAVLDKPADPRNYWLLLTVAPLTVLAAVFAHRSCTGAAAVFGAVAFGIVIPLLVLTPQPRTADTRTVALTDAAWLVLGVIVGAGLNRRSALLCSGIGVLAAVLAALGDQLFWPRILIAVVTTLTGMTFIGSLPGVALVLSKLTRYGDHTVRGERSKHRNVDHVIEKRFTTLTWTVIAVSFPTGSALLSSSGQENPWATGLTPTICPVLLLYTHILPLVSQRIALLIVGLVPLLAMFVGSSQLSPTSRSATATALLTTLLNVALIRPSAVLTAKLRRAVEVAEALLIITTIPLALGALDVYADLLETFRRSAPGFEPREVPVTGIWNSWYAVSTLHCQ